MSAVLSPRINYHDVMPARPITSLAADVVAGFANSPRMLPPKYFYDERGSQLFDKICATPEYYPTRTEDALLQHHAEAIIREVQPGSILEIGSGSSRKTRHLFNACSSLSIHSHYAPLDVCREMLIETSEALVKEYEWLKIDALVGDYDAGLTYIPDHDGVRLFLFLGSTIGNIEHGAAVDFLRDLRDSMRPGDRLLLGMDRTKAADVLHAAYNDAEGVTAQFNLNILSVLNRELNAGFRTDWFRHHATYNPEKKRVEMYLIAESAHEVPFRDLDMVVPFAEGDAILTECSHKYTRADIVELLTAGGFEEVRHMESGNRFYSLVLAAPAGSR